MEIIEETWILWCNKIKITVKYATWKHKWKTEKGLVSSIIFYLVSVTLFITR